MARINIDDALFNDERFLMIIEEVGRFAAAGAWVYILKMAQRYWVPNRQPIPANIYELQQLPEAFVRVGLVEKNEEGYIVPNSDLIFVWLFQRHESSKKAKQTRELSKIHKESAKTNTESMSLEDRPDSDGSSNGDLLIPIPIPIPTQINTKHMSSETTSAVVSLWNDVYAPRFGLTKVKTSGALWSKRLKKLKQICKDVSIEQWHIVFQSLKDKRFIRPDGSVFIPDFDYVFRHDRWAKILEEHVSLIQFEDDSEDFPDAIESHSISPEDYLKGFK